ncbi:hypothetical protein MAAFP003_1880 [Mycobacterium ahvazicum]|uniref:ESX-1 secretion-associated protein EspA/EspE-like domain-containing protein n=1 Tax=Mycobacterium ahvazicum TaxID=1964395 RepID=A0A2K4Y8T8_9MYCO|nr:EspA/EspE family type VII secretion system effector [Mycobacterium ahvazicum]SOX53210.1 hypothetical protein MAAFP003_1880 [Mycobacterium ahvazicum]
MSVFSAVAQVLANLGSVGGQAATLGLDSTGWSNPTPSTMAKAATGTGIAATGLGVVVVPAADGFVGKVFQHSSHLGREAMMAKMGGSAGAARYAQGMSIISWTITIVELLSLTTGFGYPYEGNSVESGSEEFQALATELQSALPGADWTGAASEAYAEVNRNLADIAAKLAQLDLELAALTKEHAELVAQMRLAFGALKATLLGALVTELAITMLVPAPVGPSLAMAFAISVAVAAIAASLGFLSTVLGYSVQRAQGANALANRYAELAPTPLSQRSAPPTPIPQSKSSTVPHFNPAGGQGVSAVGGHPVTASDAGRGEGRHVAQQGVAATVGIATPATPKAREHGAPAAATATMPTLVQLASRSGSAASVASQLTPHAELFSRARAQLLAQPAQQSKSRPGEAAPGPDGARAGEASENLPALVLGNLDAYVAAGFVGPVSSVAAKTG